MDLSLIISSILIPLFLVAAAIFSLSETSITASSRAKLHSLSRKGDPNAEIVKNLQSDITRVIGCLLIAATVTNVCLTSLATGVFVELFGELGVAYASVVMSVLTVVYAEVMPKLWALHNSEKAATTVAKFVQKLVRFSVPITIAVEFLAKKHLALLGADVENKQQDSIQEELRGAIDLHRASTPDINEEGVMLRSILDLAMVDVGHIMIHRKNVVMLDVEEKLDNIIKELLSTPYSRIPLWKDNQDNIIGVLHTKSFLKLMHNAYEKDQEITIEDIISISSSPWFVPETTTLYDQLQYFKIRREHFAIVVDEYGSFMGIVTLEDVLEEIVGDITDEYDKTPLGVKEQTDGSYLVEGTTPIRDLNRQFDWELPDDKAATIAGLLLYETRQIPEVGQVFVLHNFKFEVVKRQRNQITLLKIQPHLYQEAG